MAPERRVKVAVLGGGLGAVAAAFELSKTPELRERFEVTLYQQGWRLGGKGASGRNAAHGSRIEEHGLHAFLGFYEHAFALMRAVYAEWDVAPSYPFQSWKDAFAPQRQVTLEEALAGGGYASWTIALPRLPGEPGDGSPLPTPERLLASAIRWLDARLREARAEGLRIGRVTSALTADIVSLLGQASAARTESGAWLAHVEHEALDAAHQLARWLEADAGAIASRVQPAIAGLLSSVRAAVRDALATEKSSDALRRLATMLELGLAIALGTLRDVMAPGSRGFDAINDRDFRRWLESHGATPEVAWSAPVRALYDLGFAYEGGVADAAHASAAAGVVLRVLLYLALGYKDAPLWKMQAGMGDAVFTPLYEVLARQRGVRVELFRRVQALRVSPDGNLVERIEVSRQVDFAAPYDPLVEVKGLRCWPSEPRWELLVDGQAMQKDPDRYAFESAGCGVEVGRDTLVYGRDFDFVVLGISVGALPVIAYELAGASPRWRAMLDTTRTVQTQALQLWLTPALAELGWTAGTTILTGYAEPFDSWGEMSHLIPREDWGAREVPATIAYFCGALPEGDPEGASDRVKQGAIAWLSRNAGHLWPKATTPGNPAGLDWSKLVDPAQRVGVARFDAQFWRANVDPTERYVLSVPGSIDARLWPGDTDFRNLAVAGDWTRSSLDSGSADAAIESGTLAGQAVARLMAPGR